MLAGAHGIDLVLLTVAADDGVMPQTEEHLDILHLLGVRARHLRRSPRPTWSTPRARRGGARGDRDPARSTRRSRRADRAGVDRDRRGPRRAARGDRARSSRGQRAAAPPRATSACRSTAPSCMRGHGVVVTGTAIAGEVRDGDARARAARRRRRRACAALEVHGAAVPSARGAASASRSNLGGRRARRASARGARRLRPARSRVRRDRFDAWVEIRPGARRGAREPRARARCTSARPRCSAKLVAPRRCGALAPRRAGWAQLVLREPVLALRGDRFVLRDETARRTIGGGVVVQPVRRAPRRAASRSSSRGSSGAARRRRRDAAARRPRARRRVRVPTCATLAQALERGRRTRRARRWPSVADVIPIPDAAAPRPGRRRRSGSGFAAAALEAVAAQHREQPLARGLEMESLRGRLPWPLSPRVVPLGRRPAGRRADALVRDDSVRARAGASRARWRPRRARSASASSGVLAEARLHAARPAAARGGGRRAAPRARSRCSRVLETGGPRRAGRARPLLRARRRRRGARAAASALRARTARSPRPCSAT